MFGQPFREPGHVNVIELLLPAAPVDHDHDRKRTIAVWHPELAKLLRSVAVGDPFTRCRQRHVTELRPAQSLGVEITVGRSHGNEHQSRKKSSHSRPRQYHGWIDDPAPCFNVEIGFPSRPMNVFDVLLPRSSKVASQP